MRRLYALVAVLIFPVVLLAAAPFAPQRWIVLPNGWLLSVPGTNAAVATGNMPQGMAASPDGAMMAVVQSGFPPASLGLYRLPDLTPVATIPLPGAFGRPVWQGSHHVLVAGANADAVLDVDVTTRTIRQIPFPKDSYPALIAAAPGGDRYAVASYGDGAVRIGNLSDIARATAVPLGGYPGGIAFDSDSSRVFVSVRPKNDLIAIDTTTLAANHVATGLHPSAVAVEGGKVYVAETDADAVAVYNATDLRRIAEIGVGEAHTTGVSPNAISAGAGQMFVSLGAGNALAVIRQDRVIGRIGTGWYPTDAVTVGNRLYVLNGKGEGTRPNPGLKPSSNAQYIGTIEVGSLRALDIPDDAALRPVPLGAQGWEHRESHSVVRPNGPIKHVIFVLKENRSYDQMLGDMAAGNGDKSLAFFGADVTPNQHALATRFGLFDNAYTSGEVSAVAHLWATAAFANDYLERFWAPNYGNRYNLDDVSAGNDLRVPAAGFLWEAARRAHVSFRDYGEQIRPGETATSPRVPETPTLNGQFDPNYVGWDLDYSDLDRVKEWRREFAEHVRTGRLPQLELMFLPNDHTYGSKVGKLTPAAYVATNDYAVGQIIETVSHSRVWDSTAVFIIEDDAQDGPDHVSDQRVPLFVVSRYARPGVHSGHYSTVSVLRTIEIILGMQPLSLYDARAVPLYEAFGAARQQPYTVVPPKIDILRTNAKTAYGAAFSARADFRHPDAIDPRVLNDILARNQQR